jgi:hypothetical protein
MSVWCEFPVVQSLSLPPSTGTTVMDHVRFHTIYNLQEDSCDIWMKDWLQIKIFKVWKCLDSNLDNLENILKFPYYSFSSKNLIELYHVKNICDFCDNGTGKQVIT